jgi:hypothetical protein
MLWQSSERNGMGGSHVVKQAAYIKKDLYHTSHIGKEDLDKKPSCAKEDWIVHWVPPTTNHLVTTFHKKVAVEHGEVARA